jgi:hypothetical protein
MVEETSKAANSIQHAHTATTTDAYRAGDVVCTAYGVGVIVQQIHKSKRSVENEMNKDDDDSVFDFFAVRLWRIPGKSMGSSALAMLQPSTVCTIMNVYYKARGK